MRPKPTGIVRVFSESEAVVVHLVNLTNTQRQEIGPVRVVVFQGTAEVHDVDHPADDAVYRIVDDTGPTTMVLVGCRKASLRTRWVDKVTGHQVLELGFTYERAMSYRLWAAEQEKVNLDPERVR